MNVFDFLTQLLPPYFKFWHLPLVFLVGLIGEGYGTVVGSGGILIQFVLAALGMPLQSVVATDIAGTMGANAGVLVASPKSIWANKKLLLVLAISFFIGGVIGTIFLIKIPVKLLKYIVIAGLILILLRMIFKKVTNIQASKHLEIKIQQYPLLLAIMSALGIYGNVSGVGVGTFQKIAFVSILRISFIDSLGIGNIIMIPATIFSFIVTAISGLIAWPYLIILWFGTFIGGKNVTKYVRKIPDKYLRIILVIVAFSYLIYLLLSLFYER
jgi:hypothetical protein